MVKAVNESRLLKIIVSVILCLTVTAFSIMIKCVEVYAAIPLALPLVGAGLMLVAGILVMAGLTFESQNQATIAANQWYIDLKYSHPGKWGFNRLINEEKELALEDFENIEENIEEINGSVVEVTDNLWNYSKKWVSHYYDEGQNNINRDVYTVVDEEGNHIPYCFNHNFDDRVLLGETIEWMGNQYEWVYNGQVSVPHVGKMHLYLLMENGQNVGQVTTLIEEKPQFYIYATNEDKLRLGAEYQRTENTIGRGITNYAGGVLSGYEEQIQLARAISEEMEYNIAATGKAGVIDNQDWDYETVDGKRSVYVPKNGTMEYYEGLTYGELLTITDMAIAGEPVPGVDEEEKTWWEQLVGGVSAKVEEGAQLLVGTLADLKAWLEGTYQNVIGSIQEGTATIAEEIRAQEVEDIDPKIRQFGVFDIFILFLDVLLACIRLIIRACVYLAEIVTIPPDSSLLNDDTKSGLEFFKNQIIPVVNISVWDMFSGLMSLIISLAVVKRVRRVAESG